MRDLTELDVFYGDLTANRAYVYARLPRPADDAGLTLTGFVRGPRCLHAETLPLTARLVDLGPGPTLLARALVPEPCFWSPDLPAIYDVTVNLQRAAESIATERREIGLRSFGVQGRHFFLEGKRWVLRGVLASSTTAVFPRSWHDASAVFIPASMSRSLDDQLAEASQFGALAMAEIPRGEAGVLELRQFSRFPAVAFAVPQRDLPPRFSLRDSAPNLLLLQRIGPGDELAQQPWAQAFLAETAEADRLKKIAELGELPIIVVRPLAQPAPIDEARAACDILQRDLAPIGQFAGYIV